jgi:hypothetical protein
MPVYSIGFSVSGVTRTAFYEVEFESGVLSLPTIALATQRGGYVVFGISGLMKLNAPAGDHKVNFMLTTARRSIKGIVRASPPIEVPAIVSLHGAGSVLARFELPPGVFEAPFTFEVGENDGIDEAQFAKAIEYRPTD